MTTLGIAVAKRGSIVRRGRLSKANQGADFRLLAYAGTDASISCSRLMLTIFGGLAEFERELIRICACPRSRTTGDQPL